MATLPGMRERTVTISSAGKTFSFTGWKIGWVTGTPELVAAVRTAKQFLTYVSGGPFQYAIATGLAMPDTFYAELTAGLLRKRDLLAAGLRGAGLEVYLPQGTYFITTNVGPLGEADGLAFCRSLPHRCGVVAVPNVVFYDNRAAGLTQVRFAFCKRDEVLADAAARLRGLTSPPPGGP
jgi:N-succinyldiaminopimelate aminotransferase